MTQTTNATPKVLPRIRVFDDPILKQPCRAIEPGAAEGAEVLELLRAVARATPTAVGLAAPQIGLAVRACFIWHGRKGGEAVGMINPVLLEHSFAGAC